MIAVRSDSLSLSRATIIRKTSCPDQRSRPSNPAGEPIRKMRRAMSPRRVTSLGFNRSPPRPLPSTPIVSSPPINLATNVPYAMPSSPKPSMPNRSETANHSVGPTPLSRVVMTTLKTLTNPRIIIGTRICPVPRSAAAPATVRHENKYPAPSIRKKRTTISAVAPSRRISTAYDGAANQISAYTAIPTTVAIATARFAARLADSNSPAPQCRATTATVPVLTSEKMFEASQPTYAASPTAVVASLLMNPARNVSVKPTRKFRSCSTNTGHANRNIVERSGAVKSELLEEASTMTSRSFIPDNLDSAHGCVQSSNRNLGTRSKSAKFRVSKVDPVANAMLAIRKSNRPIRRHWGRNDSKVSCAGRSKLKTL